MHEDLAHDVTFLSGRDDRGVRKVDDRPHFDRGHDTDAHEPAGDGDRIVEILGLDDGVAAELFARFREGAVGERTPAAAGADRRRGAVAGGRLKGAWEAGGGRWGDDGIPEHPRAWLIQTARNMAIDRIRRKRVLAGKLETYAADLDEATAEPTAALDIPDDRLRLIFTC